MCSSLLETLHTGPSPNRAKTYIYLDCPFFHHQQFVVFHINMYCIYFADLYLGIGSQKVGHYWSHLECRLAPHVADLTRLHIAIWLLLLVNESHSVMSDSCDPMNCSLPGSSVHGILQARILEWVAIPFSRGSFWPRDEIRVSYIAGGFFTVWATRKALQQYCLTRHHMIWLSCLFCAENI